MAESRVKVGLRIRPLLTKEKGQNVTFNSYDKQSVNFKGNTYTFDHVFGMELSQSQLYNESASPMLRSFLEGYNCTIMAYGQTGSGKTFSMGTSDIIYQDVENQGLISRFVTDLFANLNQSLAEGRHLSYNVKASYLEIYGEEVYDLLDVSASTNNRISLPVREDETGKIFVQGQNEFIVESAESTLEILTSGARHRITASTAMNSGSSRSHAVFTLLLEQKFKSESSSQQQEQQSSNEEVIQSMYSKLTFVDLAGSERIKRTGAEGQRLKEGIQINSGLFNLGQVINALADEQKLKSGATKSNHIPYRNSKLTHLLKDALGGNSQTLFLACVSPAESNESETLSTLMYAKQARNIQNKPIQNVDKVQKELQRLRYAVKVWTMKAIKSIFSQSQSSLSSTTSDVLNNCDDFNEIIKLPEVSEFISSVNNSIEENVNKSNVEFLSPRKSVRLSVGNTLIASPHRMKNMRPLIYSPLREQRNSNRHQNQPGGIYSSPVLGIFPGMNGTYMHHHPGTINRDSMLTAFPSLLNSTLGANNGETEESEKLIARMIDMVQKEKELYLASNTNNHEVEDSDLVADTTTTTTLEETNESNLHSSIEQSATIAVSKDISQMDAVIQEKEEILSKLLDTVKGYSVMKSEFEKLLEAINGLEDEKKELENELERVKKMPGGSGTNNVATERVKERFLKVKEELRVMRDERKNKENAFRLMQRESKQCDLLQKELKKLKESRVLMAKQHKNQVQEMMKLKKDQAVKSMLFKKNDVKKQQLMNTLKAELSKKERVVALKDKEISRINMKLRACEEHITQLLKIQNRNRATKPGNNHTLGGTLKSSNALNPADNEHLASSKAMLEHMLIERLEVHIAKVMYQQKSSQLIELNRDMEQDASELEALHAEKKQLILDLRSRGILPKSDLPDDNDELSNEQVVDVEDDVDLSVLCGNANNGLSEEEKYRISQLKTSIDMCENALERLTKEADDCNADIDDLSLRLEEHAKMNKSSKSTSDGSNAGSGAAVWDVMGKEIITGLSLPQSHSLLWDLLDEKLKTLEQLRITSNSLAKCISEQDVEAEKTQELQNWVNTLREELKTRLERAEKQRVNDVWTLMQANTSSPTTTKDHTDDINVEKGINLSASLTDRIAILRANELEKELEARITNEDILKSEIENKNHLLGKLQKKLSEVTLLSEFHENVSISDDLNINTLVDGNASSNNEKMINTKSSEDENQIRKLFDIWDELGLPEDERKETLSYIHKARELAKQRAIMDADTQLQSIQKEVEVAKEHLKLLCATIGCEITQYIVDSDGKKLENKSESSLQSFLLIPLLDSLKFGAEEATEDIINKLSVVSSLKNKLIDIMSEMWLEIADLPSSLRPLAKLSISSDVFGTSSTDDLNKKYSSATIVSEQFMKLNISFKSITNWESELRKLNLTRVQTTSKLVHIRDVCIGLISELKFNDTKTELLALVNSVATSAYSIDITTKAMTNEDQLQQKTDVDDQLSSQAIHAAVQILSTNSASNPPGSEKLLYALERTKLILESVKSTRSTVGQHIANYVKHFFIHFLKGNEANIENHLTPEDLILIDVAINSKVYSTIDLDRLFKCTDFIQNHSLEMNSILKSKLQNAIMELNTTTVTIVDQQIKDYLKCKFALVNHSLSNFMNSMQEVIEELQGMNLFVEELWIQKHISNILHNWNKMIPNTHYTLVDMIKENDALLEESQRIESICEVQRELVKGDANLNKHILEMDEFEAQSKLDRAKALSGNSKLLIEEEKFRKNGKKKYEQLAERMLQSFSKLNSLTASTTISSSIIDIKPSLQNLSIKGKALLKGRFREKIELMHLALNSTEQIVLNLPTTAPATISSSSSTTTTSNIPKKSTILSNTNNASNENQKENHENHLSTMNSINNTSNIPMVSTNKSLVTKVVSHQQPHQYANPFVLDH